MGLLTMNEYAKYKNIPQTVHYYIESSTTGKIIKPVASA